jgi:hypothetical protein
MGSSSSSYPTADAEAADAEATRTDTKASSTDTNAEASNPDTRPLYLRIPRDAVHSSTRERRHLPV